LPAIPAAVDDASELRSLPADLAVVCSRTVPNAASKTSTATHHRRRATGAPVPTSGHLERYAQAYGLPPITDAAATAYDDNIIAELLQIYGYTDIPTY
jgi:chromosome partitioning protein